MTKRKIHLELIRMFAIFFVVANHTGENLYLYYLTVPETLSRLFFTAFSALDKTAVPLFFMVSGALLLPRTEDIKTVLRKRVLKYVIVLVLFSLLSYLYTLSFRLSDFSLWSFADILFAYGHAYSYWYLYAYLGFLVALPILRRMANSMTDREYVYVFLVMVLVKLSEFAVFYLLKDPVTIHSDFFPVIIEYTLFYPLIGNYLENRLDSDAFSKRNGWLVLGGILLSLALTAVTQDLYCRNFGGWTPENASAYIGNLSAIPSVGLYYLIRSLFLHHQPGPRLSRVLVFFGSAAFGVYLLQHIYLREFEPLAQLLRDALGTFPGTFLTVLLICVFGTLVTKLLKLIPGLRSLL